MDTRHPGAPERVRLVLAEGRPVVTIVLLGVFLAPLVLRTGFELTVDPADLAAGRTRDRVELAQSNPVIAVALAGAVAALLVWGIVHSYRQLGRFLDIGPEGVRYRQKRHSTLVGWHDIADVEYSIAKPHFATRFARRVPDVNFQLLVRLRDPADPRYERLLRKWGTEDESGRGRDRLRFRPFPWDAVQRAGATVEHHAPHAWRGEGGDDRGGGTQAPPLK